MEPEIQVDARLLPTMGLGSLYLLKPVSKYVGAGGVGMAGPPLLGQATVYPSGPFRKTLSL